MEIRRLSWLGIRTRQLEEMARFFEHTLGLAPGLREPGRALFLLPNGDPIDIFDETLDRYAHFDSGPVVGFMVDDVEPARAELEAAGVELVGPVQRAEGFVWAHFRGPDGTLFELQGRTGKRHDG
jgi:catechol 2,3-dioxygenase-like lactoylglutathione lyase family enzyme